TPSQGVSLGDTVTLRCHLPRLAAWVWLYQEGGWSYKKRKEKEQDTSEFFFDSTLREHAGRYRCQYQVSESAEVSVENDPVELVLTGEDTGDSKWLWLLPTGPWTNVTIRCWNKDYGAAFFLHKDGSSDPIKHQNSSGGGTATFTLFGVTPADSGTYRCSYHPKNYSFLSSPLGDSMTLEVTPTPALPRPSLSLHPSQGVSLGDTVTLCCHLPQPAAWVELYQDGLLRSYKCMDKHQVMAEFSLVCVKLEDARKYWCQYRVLEPPRVSEKSVPIELVVVQDKALAITTEAANCLATLCPHGSLAIPSLHFFLMCPRRTPRCSGIPQAFPVLPRNTPTVPLANRTLCNPSQHHITSPVGPQMCPQPPQGLNESMFLTTRVRVATQLLSAVQQPQSCCSQL
uniref:Ig-like domain-containing protein n=1 Tax=Gallus gallus TaxID=9031 RepID=A0A8V0XM12_CHICK